MRFNRKKTFRTIHSNGFTLIEVLIAIGILSIGILGIATLQITSMRGNQTAGRVTTASVFAMDRIEQFMGLSYEDDLLTGSVYDHDTDASLAGHLTANPGTGLHQPAVGSDGVDNNGNGQIDEAGESGDIGIEWQVVDDYPIMDTKWIQMTIIKGTGGAQKRVSIVSYKMNNF